LGIERIGRQIVSQQKKKLKSATPEKINKNVKRG
jgi:hypothetical protein